MNVTVMRWLLTMLLWELPAGLQAQLTYKDNRDGTATWCIGIVTKR